MGVFRFTSKYAAPTKEQRERYMAGKGKEHSFGPDNRIMIIEYPEAAYLKDDTGSIRILYTGFQDKRKAFAEAERLTGHPRQDGKTQGPSPTRGKPGGSS